MLDAILRFLGLLIVAILCILIYHYVSMCIGLLMTVTVCILQIRQHSKN